jgi:CPA2 family monovalent cation:H+ antiporter-2
MALPLLFDVGLIIFASAVLAYVAKYLRQPVIIAYVLAGLIVGPAGLGLITNTDEISLLSELGIVFLLFSVGLELDFRRLKQVGFATLLGGSVQIISTFILGFVVAAMFGFQGTLAVYIGLLMAFSSTMIVAKILADREELNTLHGRIMIGVLLLQDVVAVVALPFLGSLSSFPSIEFASFVVLKGLGIFAIAILANRFLFPRVLDYAAKKHEILFITAVANCFLFIGLSYSLGFSIAIGGFIAGLSMANFPYNVEIGGEVHALRDFFSIIFFSSLGMQLNFLAIGSYFPVFAVLLLMLLFVKPVILAATYLLMGYGGRTSSYIGLGLGQTSEFMFIIAAELFMLGSITQEFYSLLVGIVVISILLTPYLLNTRNMFYSFFSRFRIGRIIHLLHPKSIHGLENPPERALENHTVLFGAHRMGEKIVEYLKGKGEKFVVVERDPEIVKKLGSRGIYVVYGDAENEEMLGRIFLDRAKLLIMTIPYADVTSFAVRKAKMLNPKIRVFARAHDAMDAERIYKAGADVVIIPEVVSGEKIVKKIDHFLKEKKP